MTDRDDDDDSDPSPPEEPEGPPSVKGGNQTLWVGVFLILGILPCWPRCSSSPTPPSSAAATS